MPSWQLRGHGAPRAVESGRRVTVVAAPTAWAGAAGASGLPGPPASDARTRNRRHGQYHAADYQSVRLHVAKDRALPP